MVFYNGADVKAGTRLIFSGPKRALVVANILSFSADNQKNFGFSRYANIPLRCCESRLMERLVLGLDHVGWVS